MKITINATEEELKSMGLTQDELQDFVLEEVDKTVHNEMKIFHQVELEVETKIEQKKVAKQKKVR